MQKPTVSFVVPCYKLGHLLAECIDSLLSQTYADFEILILDDDSPDNTAEVANSFKDNRVIYIHNANNLGNLENYNKGIRLSRGRYVWLISADDYLINPHALQQYVELMDANPRVGYTFCPGLSMKNGQASGVSGVYGGGDSIVKGHTLLTKLFDHNFILAASVMVRRECYETISEFPLEADWGGTNVNMRWLGDWYLWCVFALAYDVGYFAEPMVCYREHDLSMSKSITREDVVMSCADSDIGMLWMLRQKAVNAGLSRVSRVCLRAIANEYRRQGTGKHFRASIYTMSAEHFDESLYKSTPHEAERRKIRAYFYDGVGDRHLSCGDSSLAWQAYLKSLRNNPLRAKVYLKLLLILTGKPGAYMRRRIRGLRSLPADLHAG